MEKNNLPIPERLDLSFYPVPDKTNYATLIKRVFDDLQTVYPNKPIGIAETYYFPDPARRQELGQAFAQEYLNRAMPQELLFWTTPDSGGAGINAGYPFDFMSYYLQTPTLPGIATKLFSGTLPTELGNYGSGNIYAPFVLLDNGIYKMWYCGQGNDGHDRIHYAESTNGLNWDKKGVVLDIDNSHHVNDPSVLKVNGAYFMYYTDAPTTEFEEIHLATSNDGVHWQKKGVALTGSSGWDKYIGRPSVIYDNGIIKMWYDGRVNSTPGTETKIGYATSIDGFSWIRNADNPVFADDAFDENQRLSKASAVNVAKVGNLYVMAYQAKGTKWATSRDGVHWVKKGLLVNLSGTDFDSLYHATPKIFLDQQGKAIAVYMGGVSVPTWDQNSIGVAKLNGDESDKYQMAQDINIDAKVDIFDYNLLVADFGKSGPLPADVDGNDKVDIFDYNLLVANFGKSS